MRFRVDLVKQDCKSRAEINLNFRSCRAFRSFGLGGEVKSIHGIRFRLFTTFLEASVLGAGIPSIFNRLPLVALKTSMVFRSNGIWCFRIAGTDGRTAALFLPTLSSLPKTSNPFNPRRSPQDIRTTKPSFLPFDTVISPGFEFLLPNHLPPPLSTPATWTLTKSELSSTRSQPPSSPCEEALDHFCPPNPSTKVSGVQDICF